jgi:hypothetical protein
MALSDEQVTALRGEFRIINAGESRAHYKLFPSPGAFLAWVSANEKLKKTLERRGDKDKEWCGLGEQTIGEIISKGYADKPLADMRKANANLNPGTLALGGRLIPSVAGGVWNVPEYLSGNPLCARVKPREKLPAKTIRVGFRAVSTVAPEKISTFSAMLTRAIWSYTLKGGAVSLRVSYNMHYRQQSPDGADGCIIELTIPLSSESSFAFGFSTAIYRGFMLGIASRAMSPVWGDSIPHHPAFKLNGVAGFKMDKVQDQRILENLGIA